MASKDFEVAFKLGAELTNSFKSTFDGANKAIKNLVGAAAAIGSMVGITEVIGSVNQMKESMNLLQNQTGVTGAELEELQGIARNLFKDNYGENFEEVTAALATVKQNMHNLDNGELQRLTGDAMLLAQTFDADISEVTRGANNLMTHFGVSSSTAMDLFATGAQRGINFSQEMFDNVAEYAPLFAEMGYSAEEYFGIMERGAKAGVYNLDYVNDVMKEFQIRTKDGSKATSEAMGMLSKDAQNVWKEFLKGNGTVSDVAAKVVGELQGMDDQVLASQIGVSLFGTKFEDLEADAVYAMLGTTEAMQGFEGAMESINNIHFDSLGMAMRGIGRILTINLVEPVVNTALPHLQTFAKYLNSNLPNAIKKTKDVLTTIAPIMLGLAAGVATYRAALAITTAYQVAFNTIQAITPKLLYAHRTALLAYTFAGGGVRGMLVAMRSAMAALNLAMLANPFVLVAAAIVGIGVALYSAYKMSSTFRNGVNSAFNEVKSIVTSVATFVAMKATTFWDGFVESVKGIGSRMAEMLGSDMISGIKGVVSNVINSFKTAFSSLPGIISMIAPTMTTMGLALVGVTGPIGLLISGVVSVIGFLYRLSQTNESVAGGLSGAWSAIQTAFAPVLDVLKQGIADFANSVGPQLTQTIAVITESVTALGPSFAEIGATLVQLGTLIVTQWGTVVSTVATTALPLLLQVVQQVFPMIASLIGGIMPVIVQLIMAIVPIILQLAQVVFPLILSVVQMVFPLILSIVQGVLPVVGMLLVAVVGTILQLAQVVLPLVLSVVQMVFPIILSVIQAIIPIITVVLQTLVAVINGVLIPAINAILAVVQIVFPYIQMIIQNALTLINGIIQAAMALLQGNWSGAWEAIKSTATTIMNNIISFFQGINLFEVGKSIITGLIDGIKSMGSAVIGAISGMIPEPIRGAASKLLGALPGFAEGGVVAAPTLAWVGEGGDTESIIPWNNSQRSKDLWLQTGHAIGALGELNTAGQNAPDWTVPSGGNTYNTSNSHGGSVINLHNYTTINAKGGVDPDEIERSVNKGNESALETLRRWQHDQARVAFD